MHSSLVTIFNVFYVFTHCSFQSHILYPFTLAYMCTHESGSVRCNSQRFKRAVPRLQIYRTFSALFPYLFLVYNLVLLMLYFVSMWILSGFLPLYFVSVSEIGHYEQ